VIGTDKWMAEPPCVRKCVPHGQLEGGVSLSSLSRSLALALLALSLSRSLSLSSPRSSPRSLSLSFHLALSLSPSRLSVTLLIINELPSGLGSRNLRLRAEAHPTGRAVSRERLGDWDGPIKVKPPCVRQGVPHGQTETGVIVLAVTCWSPCAQRRCYPTGRCAYRPSVTS